MRLFTVLIIVLCATPVVAQDSIERFPVFAACENVETDQVESCFYKTLYAALKANYTHPDNATSGVVTLRFEVNRDGDFVPVQLDAIDASMKDAMVASFNQLPQITAPTYNGRPSYMQFVLTAPVPMSDSGSFQVFNGTKDKQRTRSGTVDLDSLAFAKANNEYTAIKSTNYVNQELRSNTLIPLSQQRYSAYEMAMNQIGNNAHTAVKPYTFSYVNQYYDLQGERDALEIKSQTWLGRKWWNEHFFQLAGDDYWFVVDPGVDLQIGKDTGDDLNTFNNTRLINVSGGVGREITFGASIHESQGIFAGYFNRVITDAAPDGGNPGIVPGRGIAEDGGDGKFDYPMATGYVNYKPSPYFDLQLGHGQHFIGDGYRSLVLSDNAQPNPYFKVNAKFWKLDYTVLYTSLRDVRPEVTADGSFRTKYMVHHYLSWNATKNLNIGLFESVLWENDNDRGFDFNYVNPVIFYQTVELETGSRGGNALLGVTAKYKFTNRVTGYAQLVLDEFSGAAVASGNGSFQNKSGYQLGLKWQNAFIHNLSLQVEYNRVRPYTYSHNSIVLNYANSNQALAHPWGANFYEAIFIARYTKDRWYGLGKFIYGKRGFDVLDGTDNAFYGGNIYRTEDERVADLGNTLAQGNTASFTYAQLEAGYIINPASRLTIYGQVIHRAMSPQFDNAVVREEKTTWINFGLRTDIFNWSYDR